MNDRMSDVSSLLDKLLSAGKEYVGKGQDFAESKLDIPDQGPEREAMVDGMKKGAIASAVLVGLLGTKSGRSLTGSVIKLGSLAALGVAAVKGYQNWQETGDPLKSSSASSSSGTDPKALHELSDADSASRSLLIIKSLVAAANADGHIDSDEIQTIRHELIEMHLPESLANDIEAILDVPLTAEQLAAQVSSAQAASEVYLATRLIINDLSSSQEQSYLQDLVKHLGISEGLRASLESEVS